MQLCVIWSRPETQACNICIVYHVENLGIWHKQTELSELFANVPFSCLVLAPGGPL